MRSIRLISLVTLIGMSTGVQASHAEDVAVVSHGGTLRTHPPITLPAPKDGLLGVDLLGFDLEWRLTRGPVDLRLASYNLSSFPRVFAGELWAFELDENRTIATGLEAGLVVRPFTRAGSNPVAAIGLGVGGRYRRVARHGTLGTPGDYLYDEVSLSPALDWSVVVAGRWRLALSTGIPLVPVGIARVVYRDEPETEVFSPQTEPGVRSWRVEAPASVTVGIATGSQARTLATANGAAAETGHPANAEPARAPSRDRPAWQESVVDDRWQLGFVAVAGDAPAPIAQRFLDRRRAMSVSVHPWSVASLLRLQNHEPEEITAFPYEDLATVGLRAYPLLSEGPLLVSGISLGVEASAGHEWREDPSGFRRTWGVSVSPVAGFSAKYFEWLWLELAFGSQVRVAAVTDARGAYTGLVGEPSVDVVPRATVRAGVSFGEWE